VGAYRHSFILRQRIEAMTLCTALRTGPGGARVPRRASAARNAGLPGQATQAVEIGPDARVQSRQERRPQSGRFGLRRLQHRQAEQVGLALQEPGVAPCRRPRAGSVAACRRRAPPRRSGRRPGGRHRPARRGDLGLGGAAGQSEKDAACLRHPVRRPQSYEAGHEQHRLLGSACSARASTSGAVVNSWRPSRSHCTAAPATKTLPSRAYCGGRPGSPPAWPGGGAATDRPVSRVQEKRPGAVGTLGPARGEPALPNRAACWSARDTGNRQAVGEEASRTWCRSRRRLGGPPAAARGYAEVTAQLLIPGGGFQVE